MLIVPLFATAISLTAAHGGLPRYSNPNMTLQLFVDRDIANGNGYNYLGDFLSGKALSLRLLGDSIDNDKSEFSSDIASNASPVVHLLSVLNEFTAEMFVTTFYTEKAVHGIASTFSLQNSTQKANLIKGINAEADAFHHFTPTFHLMIQMIEDLRKDFTRDELKALDGAFVNAATAVDLAIDPLIALSRGLERIGDTSLVKAVNDLRKELKSFEAATDHDPFYKGGPEFEER